MIYYILTHDFSFSLLVFYFMYFEIFTRCTYLLHEKKKKTEIALMCWGIYLTWKGLNSAVQKWQCEFERCTCRLC